MARPCLGGYIVTCLSGRPRSTGRKYRVSMLTGRLRTMSSWLPWLFGKCRNVFNSVPWLNMWGMRFHHLACASVTLTLPRLSVRCSRYRSTTIFWPMTGHGSWSSRRRATLTSWTLNREKLPDYTCHMGPVHVQVRSRSGRTPLRMSSTCQPRQTYGRQEASSFAYRCAPSRNDHIAGIDIPLVSKSNRRYMTTRPFHRPVALSR